MATLTGLIDRVRVELGDLGKSFVTQFVADGTTNRFKLHYAPLDGNGVIVLRNNIDVSNQASVEESTGVLVTDFLPADGDEFTISGNYYRYFTAAEMGMLVNDALIQHTGRAVDSVGRKITLANLPAIEEYPLAIYAVTLALYTLATDSAFDIDISAPDGVSIPRTERYRQLMEMVQTRREQYRELCTFLGVGMYKIEVFSLRRVSYATGRYIPEYKPQEVDDRSYPQRVHLPEPTYGDAPAEWPTQGEEFTAYQGRAFIATVNFSGTYDPSTSFIARLLSQRGSLLHIMDLGLTTTTDGLGNYTATISLTADNTTLLANRTYWSLELVDPNLTDPNSGSVWANEIKGGNFFTVRANEVVL